MSLPKWIADQDYAWEPCNNPDWNKLRKALTIAVEALTDIQATSCEIYKTHPDCSCSWNALRRIEELGK